MQYGGGARTVARKTGLSFSRSQSLVAAHHRHFHQTRQWSDRQISEGRWNRRIFTAHGWSRRVDRGMSEQSLRNFRVQGTGADITRLGHIYQAEAGIKVLAPVHDAYLIEGPERDIEEIVEEATRQMIRAGERVIGAHLRVEAQIIRHPDRFFEKTGIDTWNRVMKILSRLKDRQPSLHASPEPSPNTLVLP
jgi:DNA polymerase I-like protein with 3'-5' exonuclease and polymerase domains